jgi:hypothetical protein
VDTLAIKTVLSVCKGEDQSGIRRTRLVIVAKLETHRLVSLQPMVPDLKLPQSGVIPFGNLHREPQLELAKDIDLVLVTRFTGSRFEDEPADHIINVLVTLIVQPMRMTTKPRVVFKLVVKSRLNVDRLCQQFPEFLRREFLFRHMRFSRVLRMPRSTG